MSYKGVPMHQIQEILRLSRTMKCSLREIARSLRLSPTTVSKYLEEAREIPWPLPEGWTEQTLQNALLPKGSGTENTFRKKDAAWDQIHLDRKKQKGVTLQLLWEEYLETLGPGEEGYAYSQFCARYNEYVGRLRPSLRQVHVAGDKLFVDYAGTTVPILDCRTGEVRFLAQIFVAVLGCSNYTYFEATESQSLPHWIGSHNRTFRHIGGVPGAVVPDNLRSGVDKPDFYEPLINETYQEMAVHYGTVILPAKIRRATYKAKAEKGVQLVTSWVLARLRKRPFFSLEELNAALRGLREDLNARPFKKLPGSRKSTFETLEKAALGPLPRTPYEMGVWKMAAVHVDYHVEVDRHYYSVPYTLLHQSVRVRSGEHAIEIFFRGERVASHLRSRVAGAHTTCPEHLPPSHQFYREWSPERFVQWAEKIGPSVRTMIQRQFLRKSYPEQAFRRCLGILNLARSASPGKLDAACKKALSLDQYTYRSISILLKNLPETPMEAGEETSSPAHDNVRGAAYYRLEEGNE
ncbi:MAG: IS21 family transposase [Solirubrobacteraceae bacterium]